MTRKSEFINFNVVKLSQDKYLHVFTVGYYEFDEQMCVLIVMFCESYNIKSYKLFA
ncbi:hypothetical protein EMUCRT_0518 [Ehrlichia cf. muris str. EmCRT]|uniref:Uncharacterized protein n=1 Tax=Ehrlichia cf. muris str. EmCRT TaxID=1359167 RepID=A0A0F3NBY3_9RICK|nr:hypothetical protein EMUCRT_0518 [Ehrlichia cf. muris str. EmCRT]